MATPAQVLPRITTVASIVPSCTNSHLDQIRLSTATLTTDQPLPCQTTKADLWFAETPREQQQAKHLCGGCPIRRRCLAGALHRRESCGIWGGEIFYKGTIVAHQPTRGRRRIQLATTITRCINQMDQPVVDNAATKPTHPKADPHTSKNHYTSARRRKTNRTLPAQLSAATRMGPPELRFARSMGPGTCQ
jgi:WhiB family redox-sensing transcriptional regulator